MYFHNTKCTLKLILLGAWTVVLYTVYCAMYLYPGRSPFQLNETEYYNNITEYYKNITEYYNNITEYYNNITEYYMDKNNYLINVPGCSIPDYSKTYKIVEAKDLKKTCDPRAIHVNKTTDDTIIFTIDKNIGHYSNGKYSCCYQFLSPSSVKGKLDVRVVRYSNCTPFTNGTKTDFKGEIIFVTCKTSKKSSKNDKSKDEVIYRDVYGLVKKINRPKESNKHKWNILILGMDTMSRARFYSSMPKTARHFKKYKWLDYRAYQKVGYNTFPNVMSLLTGKNTSTIYKSCSAGMDHCNDMMIWSDFKNAGYITATGEDFLRLPDTFSKFGYVSSPTDHYLRPLFVTGEETKGNHVCTQKKSSVKHILDYALDFAKTYKNQNTFGLFWTNSYSHNLDNIPMLIDGDIEKLFKKLYISGVFDNTFVFFISDHGMRYGKMRLPYESYYEERLPMLFLSVPQKFRQMYAKEFKNMQINQRRLITPYDLYLTFQNIIGKTNITADACPSCLSIFKEVSPYRTCADAGVDDKWCSCHKLTSIEKTDPDVANSLQLVQIHLQEKIKNIKTVPCKQCEDLKLKTVLRTHTYYDQLNNSTFYVLAIKMTPGDIAYEAIVSKNEDNYTLWPVETITPYNTRGNCVINQNHRSYCVCKFNC